MAGGGHDELCGEASSAPSGCGQSAGVRGGDVGSRQMNAVGTDGQSDIGPMVDEQSRGAFGADDAQGFAGERLKLADAEVLLTELDVIDSSGGGLADGLEKARLALGLGAGKLSPIGDVVDQHA